MNGKSANILSPKKSFLLSLTKEDKLAYSILLGIIFLIVLIRSNFFNIPFERDEGAYSYYGKLLLEGKTPYIDFYEQKFPGIFYFYAAMVAIFGDTVKGMHLGFTILNIVTVVLLFSAARKLFSPLAASITALTYAIVSMTPGLSGFTIQAEHGVALFTSIGIYFYAISRAKQKLIYYFLIGLSFGAAFMTKTSGVFVGLWGGIVIVSDCILQNRKIVVKEIFKRISLYSLGVFLVIGLLFLLIALEGSFTEMFYWSYNIPKKYVGKIKWEDGKQYLEYAYKSITADYKFFWYHAGLALILLLFKNISWPNKIMAVTLIGLSSATIFPGYYFYGHYWIQILPALAILAGLTFYAICDIIATKLNVKSPNVKYAYLVVFIIFSLMHLNKHKDYYFHPNYDRILRNVYGNNPFPESMKIAEYINANSTPEDKIAVMGSEPQIYFYTKKQASSRHCFFSAIVENVPEHHEWQREFVRGIEKDKPRYFIFFNHPISLFVQPGADQYVFEWYNKYVTENYNMIGLVDMIEGYSSTYVWKEQLATYQPQAQNRIYIFERKK